MKKKKQYGLLIAWIILLVVDWAFRGLGWLAHNLTGIRFLANYLLSAIALLGLLYLFALLEKKLFFGFFIPCLLFCLCCYRATISLFTKNLFLPPILPYLPSHLVWCWVSVQPI